MQDLWLPVLLHPGHFSGEMLSSFLRHGEGRRWNGKDIPHVWCWKCAAEQEGLHQPRVWSSPSFFLDDCKASLPGNDQSPALLEAYSIGPGQQRSQLDQGGAYGGVTILGRGPESRRSVRLRAARVSQELWFFRKAAFCWRHQSFACGYPSPLWDKARDVQRAAGKFSTGIRRDTNTLQCKRCLYI